MGFRTRIKVRFDDEDHARIVYFPRFFHFFHVAFEEFFAQNGYPYRDVLDVDKCGWPAVRAEAEFERTLRFGDTLEVDVWVERLGTSSAIFAYRGKRMNEPGDVVRGKVTVVCVDMDTFESRPIPDKYRMLFANFMTPPGP
jgi:4-hydroxybenzoyl-CoA thioesterase